MTYDSPEQLSAFHAENNLPYPLLQDKDAYHVDTLGMLVFTLLLTLHQG